MPTVYSKRTNMYSLPTLSTWARKLNIYFKTGFFFALKSDKCIISDFKAHIYCSQKDGIFCILSHGILHPAELGGICY